MNQPSLHHTRALRLMLAASAFVPSYLFGAEAINLVADQARGLAEVAMTLVTKPAEIHRRGYSIVEDVSSAPAKGMAERVYLDPQTKVEMADVPMQVSVQLSKAGFGAHDLAGKYQLIEWRTGFGKRIKESQWGHQYQQPGEIVAAKPFTRGNLIGIGLRGPDHVTPDLEEVVVLPPSSLQQLQEALAWRTQFGSWFEERRELKLEEIESLKNELKGGNPYRRLVVLRRLEDLGQLAKEDVLSALDDASSVAEIGAVTLLLIPGSPDKARWLVEKLDGIGRSDTAYQGVALGALIHFMSLSQRTMLLETILSATFLPEAEKSRVDMELARTVSYPILKRIGEKAKTKDGTQMQTSDPLLYQLLSAVGTAP